MNTLNMTCMQVQGPECTQGPAPTTPSCVCAVAAFRLTAVGLPAQGCMQQLCIPLSVNTALHGARIKTPHVNEEYRPQLNLSEF